MEDITQFFNYQQSYAAVTFMLRWVVALTLIPFGIMKIAKHDTLSKNFPAVMDLSSKTSFYLAMFAEIAGPLCLFFGFFTRFAALGGILNMGLAYKIDKKTPGYYAMPLPILLGYIAVFIAGPGAWSLDHLMFY